MLQAHFMRICTGFAVIVFLILRAPWGPCC